MSEYELYLAKLSYKHFKETGSREFTYEASGGNDMMNATNATMSLEDAGYISDVIDYGERFEFQVADKLIRYMEREGF